MTGKTARLAFCHSLLWLAVGLLLSTAAQAEPLRIGSWEKKTDVLTVASEAILSHAYAEVGQPVEFVDLPLRRAMQMLLSGEIDGNVHRIAELAAEEPSLIRVATPINATQARIYTTAKGMDKSPANWAQLRGLRVTYQRGVLVIERNLPADCQRVESVTIVDAYRKLDAGMVDVVIAVEPAQSPPDPAASATHLVRTPAILEEFRLYHYLGPRHRDLAQRLNKALARMQASGEMDEIRRKVLAGPH